jgi:hypothetical protein
MDKKKVAYINNGILIIKKNKIMLFAKKWMDLESNIGSKQDRLIKTSITYFLSYVESKNKT